MKIFMVDDDKGAMQPFRDLLEKVGGHTVTKVESVRAARLEFEKGQSGRGWPFDLLILDVHIQPEKGEAENGPVETSGDPSHAGLDLHREFRERYKYEKVLILTNLLYRVPAELRDGVSTIARDKVAVSGTRLLDVINDFVHPGSATD